MDPYQSYYVYTHNKGNQIYYVGIGTLDRPWQFNNRQEDHREWLRSEIESGRRLDYIVEIVSENITKQEALTQEMELIDKHRPVFNRNYRLNNTHKLTEEDIDLIKELRELNYSYKRIAEEVGVSTMTIHRCFTGKTKGYLE